MSMMTQSACANFGTTVAKKHQATNKRGAVLISVVGASRGGIDNSTTTNQPKASIGKMESI